MKLLVHHDSDCCAHARSLFVTGVAKQDIEIQQRLRLDS
jgi:hypothetical protein